MNGRIEREQKSDSMTKDLTPAAKLVLVGDSGSGKTRLLNFLVGNANDFSQEIAATVFESERDAM